VEAAALDANETTNDAEAATIDGGSDSNFEDEDTASVEFVPNIANLSKPDPGIDELSICSDDIFCEL
jgi:hypothetical protein